LEVDQDIEVVQIDLEEEQRENSISDNEPKKTKAPKRGRSRKHK
jgi:hypothetical protein